MSKFLGVFPVLMLIGGIMLMAGGNADNVTPVPVPVAGDVLGQCYKADRASKVTLLRSMASQEFPNDAAKAKAWNDGVDAARLKDFKPFVDEELAGAFMDGKLKELADKLEVAK